MLYLQQFKIIRIFNFITLWINLLEIELYEVLCSLYNGIKLSCVNSDSISDECRGWLITFHFVLDVVQHDLF